MDKNTKALELSEQACLAGKACEALLAKLCIKLNMPDLASELLDHGVFDRALSAIREELAEPMKQEPVKQEPVAWIEVERGIPMFAKFAKDYKPKGDGFIPFYDKPQELNLNCPSVQARLANVWGYVKADQYGDANEMVAEHVKREVYPCPTCGKYQSHSFSCGHSQFVKYPAPAEPELVDLTCEEVTALIMQGASDGGLQGFASWVQKAFKEKQK